MFHPPRLLFLRVFLAVVLPLVAVSVAGLAFAESPEGPGEPEVVSVDMALILALVGGPLMAGVISWCKRILRGDESITAAPTAWQRWFRGPDGSRVIAALAPAIALGLSFVPWPGLPWELRLVALLGAAGIAVPGHGITKPREAGEQGTGTT